MVMQHTIHKTSYFNMTFKGKMAPQGNTTFECYMTFDELYVAPLAVPFLYPHLDASCRSKDGAVRGSK